MASIKGYRELHRIILSRDPSDKSEYARACSLVSSAPSPSNYVLRHLARTAVRKEKVPFLMLLMTRGFAPIAKKPHGVKVEKCLVAHGYASFPSVFRREFTRMRRSFAAVWLLRRKGVNVDKFLAREIAMEVWRLRSYK